MTELEHFEARFAAAYRRYLDEVPTQIDPAAVARVVARAYPRRRYLGWPIGWTVIPRQRLVVLLLVAALLVALMGGLLSVGSHRGPTGWQPTGWQRLEVPGGGGFTDVVKTDAGFVAVGSTETGAGAWTSRDCLHWAAIPTGDAFVGAYPEAVTTGGPGFVAVGVDPLSAGVQRGVIWTSADGRTWARVPDDPSFDKMWLSDVIEWHGRLVAVGGGQPTEAGRTVPAIWTSEDGVRWARVTPLDGDDPGFFGGLNRVIAGGPGLVAIGEVDAGAPVWMSRDGLAWQRAPDGGWGRDARLIDIARGVDGRLVALGVPGVHVWVSDDGISWDVVVDEPAAKTPGARAALGFGLVSTNPGFFAVGYDVLLAQGSASSDGPEDLTQQGVIWTSSDGRSWARLPDDPVFEFAALTRVMVCGDTLIASGSDAHGTQSSGWHSAVWALPGGG